MWKIITLLLFFNFSFAQTIIEANDFLDHSDYKKAMQLFEIIKKNAIKEKDIEEFVRAKNGIAVCYMELGANYKALSILKENERLFTKEKSNNFELLAQTHRLLADNYNNFYRLEEYYKECHLFYKYYKKAFPEKKIYKALYYAYIGRYYNLRGMVYEALKYTDAALKIFHQNKNESHLIDEYVIYNAHLFTMRNAAPTKEIRFKYVDSLQYFLNRRYPYDNLKKSRLLISVAAPNIEYAVYLYNKNSNDVKLNLKHADKAISIYDEALKINDKLAGYYYANSAFINSLRGLMYFYKGDYKKALENYNEGIERLTVPGVLIENDFNNNNPLLADIYSWKAWCLDDMYEKNKDINLLYEIESTLLKSEKVWLRFTHEILKNKKDYNMNSYVKQPYNNLARVYYNLYNGTGEKKYLAQYYKYDEKSKYSALLENLINERKKTEKKSKTRNDINLTYSSFEELLLKINNKIELENSKAYYLSDFKKNFTKYQKFLSNESIFKNREFASLTSAQKKLKEEEAIVSYNTSGNQNNYYTTILIVTKYRSDVIKITTEKNKEFIYEQPKVQQLLEHLKNNDVLNYKKTALDCYQNYFKPIEKYLPSTIRHIKIVPSVNFANLPFDMLLTQESNSVDYRKLPYLGKKYHFSYALSETISNLVEKKEPENNLISVFAPEFNDKNLSKLPLAYKSAKTISDRYNTQLINGENATKKTFSEHLAINRMVALFSHGRATSDVLKNENGVYFSDGLLSLSDIYNLKSSCDFLLLGACETAVGDYDNSEGNINLARAFTSIGVKSMMLSSWKIDEKSSMKIIESFLSYLNKGYSKSEALHKAKADFLKKANVRTANPLYWAGLNITGNNETIPLDRNQNWIWLTIIAGTIGIGIFFFIRKKF